MAASTPAENMMSHIAQKMIGQERRLTESCASGMTASTRLDRRSAPFSSSEDSSSSSFQSVMDDGINLNNSMGSMGEYEHGSTSSSENSYSLYKLDESSINHQLVEVGDEYNSLPEPSLNESVFSFGQQSVSQFPPCVKDWNLETILGEGNFGQVWQVSRKDASPLDDCCYALKMLSKYQLVCDDEVDLVIAEKRLMKQCNQHPFVIKLRNSWQDDNLVYFLLDFLQGGELYTRMLDHNVNGRADEMPPRKALEESHVQFYVACIADGLHYLHSKRICYRDLKPENVMLDDQGYPVLIDLGAAKLFDEGTDRTYTMCGTPRYVAPEMAEGSAHSFGVDHWALATLAYEMLTGIHPFDDWGNNDDASLFAAIVDDDYKPLPEFVSSDASDWINKLLVKDPTKRMGYAPPDQFREATCERKSELLKHPWLAHMKMRNLRERARKAPWQPSLADGHDSSFFDDWSYLDPLIQPSYPKLCAKEAALFDSFDDEE